MKTTPKPAPGDIWRTADGGRVLVAGFDGIHVTVCSVAIRPDGSVVAHPRGRKAEQVLLPAFLCGRYVGVAKARTAEQVPLPALRRGRHVGPVKARKVWAA